MTKKVCIYHNADLDGKCSAAIVLRHFGENNVELVGMNYRDEFPWEKIDGDTDVIMVDFSLQPFPRMLELEDRCANLVWIDHHKSAIDDYNGQSRRWETSLRTDQAACELVWDYYCTKQPMPQAVYYIGRYDIWQWRDKPDILSFQYGLNSVENSPSGAIWDSILAVGPEVTRVTDSLVHAGQHIVRYKTRQNAVYAQETAFPLTWKGLRFIASNVQLSNSAVFDAVFDPEKHDAMLTFGYRKGGWSIGLYSNPELCQERGIHLGALAKEFGGGGHPGAAGFSCLSLPFDLPLEKA